MRLAAVALACAVSLLGCGPPRAAGSCDGPCPASKIDHLVIVVQENHTFDNYFGQWCTAPTGSNPTCSSGPACCEAGPATDPSGASATLLDDTANGAYSPDHDQSCELDEQDGGKMDKYVTSTVCGDARNFAYVDPQLIKPYRDYAQAGALADRYFQPLVGASASNDMYLARARFVFKDNAFVPDAIGSACSFIPTKMEFSDPTIGDLLVAHGNTWAWYGEGYQTMKDAQAMGACPEPPDDCPAALGIYPCVYDPSDVPFQYYTALRDNPIYMRDFTAFDKDLKDGKLPQVAFIKAIGYRSEHPSLHTTISAGVSFVTSVVSAVQASAYAPDTLVLLLYDEGGGYFDHVTPPKPSPIDGQPLGTRIPAIAIGPFAKKGFISHVELEHSSVVKFIEWNWLGMKTGQLGNRDLVVNNLGSLLDPAATGTPVPEM
jgi:phospholipase C